MHTGVSETIGDVVRRHAQIQPDSPALIAEGQQSLTYRELADLLDRIQGQLNAAGFGRGDRIAIIGPNDAETTALITGVWGCAAAVPMNPALSVGEFAIYLRDLKAQAVVVDAALDSPVRAVARDIGLPVLEMERTDTRVAGMIDLRATAPAGTPARPGRARPEDLALVLPTSGTTSHSKIVPTNQAQLSTKVIRMAEGYNLTAADRCLNLMPLFHGHGLQSSLGATLYSGGSLITLSQFSVEAFFRLLETMAPTWYSGSYTFHHTICAAAPDFADAISKSHLRFIKTASGHLDIRVAEETEALFGTPVIETYSSTEAGRIAGTPLPPVRRKPGTVGLPVEGEVAILGLDDRFLPPGERGEVVIRAAPVFSGYENDPVANAQCFVDGWFRTGDEGIIDRDGYLTLTGRIKDIINRGGEKITPSEVDNALMSHPDVAAAVTFPVPHATLGQEVAAAVVPAQGAEFTDETLTRFLRGRLAPFKVPRRFVIVDEIPKGATGKVQRRNLAEAFGLVMDSSRARPVTVDNRPATALESKLQCLWAEVLGLQGIGLNDDFFMLGGDSLQAVELFLRIERELGRRLPRSVLFEDGTVAKMARRIEDVVPSPCVVPIQPHGDRPPLFCIHDGNGHVLNYRELSRFLGPEQPFYGIQCRGLDGEEEPFTKIDDMAAHYVREIRKVQPEGPYYLGGYSFGGRVAYVIARMLRAAGEDVALLALIDTYCHAGRRRVGLREWLRHHRDRLKEQSWSQIPAYLWLRTTNFVWMAYMELRLRSYAAAWRFYKSRGKPLPRFLCRPVPANDMIRRNYETRTYDGDAVLFRAERYAWTHPDQHDGWYGLIKGRLEVRPISGGHFEITRQPHVRTLAAELSDALTTAQAAHTRHIRISAEAS
jgi:acyl-CoA synthetase (AMP-forming)/AMP-acid ligase II/thioesterase domain-containing protein/acyl carrier protein